MSLEKADVVWITTKDGRHIPISGDAGGATSNSPSNIKELQSIREQHEPSRAGSSHEKISVSPNVGNSQSVRQSGFREATSTTEVNSRFDKLNIRSVEGDHFNLMSLEQKNDILARAEYLHEMGFDLRGITVRDHPEGEFSRGLVARIAGRDYLSLEHKTPYGEKDRGIGSMNRVVAHQIGDVFAHEAAHVLRRKYASGPDSAFTPDSVAGKFGYDIFSSKQVSQYAGMNPEEWHSEMFSAVTRPGYAMGTLRNDREFLVDRLKRYGRR